MELRQLTVFLAIAEELHFGRAAERLHLAQSSVSERLRQLEREVGVQLIARNSHRPGLPPGRRQQHHDCRIQARMDPGTATGGLSIRLDEAHHYDLETGGGHVRVIARIGPLRQQVASRPLPPGPVTLAIDIRTHDILPPSLTSSDQLDSDPLGVFATGPDTITLSAGGEALAELDGRYLSTEVATGFTGRVIGMYATERSAAFDWFAYQPMQP